MQILVVDDSPTIRALAESILTELEYEVVLAENAEQAISALKIYPIQLVILDWIMPGMDGIELAALIRNTFVHRYTYIIMLTAKDGIDDMVMGLESGIDDFMIKPFAKREIHARIKIGERIINLENQLRDNFDRIDQSHQEWQATTGAIPQLICLLDHDGNVIRTNGTLSGWQLAREDEIQGRKLHNLLRRIFPQFAAQIRLEWTEAYQQLNKGHSHIFDGKDISTGRFFHVQYEPIHSTIRDDMSFAAVSIHDVTQQKELQLQLTSAKEQLEEEHEKSERLLLNILPFPIAQRLKQGEETIAEKYDEVSVLFADIVGFTALSKNITPESLVEMLNEIFSTFDFLTAQHGLEKIKTIGDAYLVVGGLPTPRPDHIQAIAKMALKMMEAIAVFNIKYNHNLSIRVGIDCGPVVAGVIGKNKFIYDLWGETVNTASRMESSGIQGCIQVTHRAYLKLCQEFELQSRGEISVKGMGNIHTYLLSTSHKG